MYPLRSFCCRFARLIYCLIVVTIKEAVFVPSEDKHWFSVKLKKNNELTTMRTLCKVKMIDKIRNQELTDLLGLEETLDGLANVMVWACFDKNNGDIG